jgi:hypothetical protein
LVRELNISADSIFYPENHSDSAEIDYLVRLLKQCGKREIKAIIALVEELLKETE